MSQDQIDAARAKKLERLEAKLERVRKVAMSFPCECAERGGNPLCLRCRVFLELGS